MKVTIGSDHAGFQVKEELKKWLKQKNVESVDMGVDSMDSVDYPDFAEKVALPILKGEAKYGILVCGSGIGMAIAANKLPGIRAATCNDQYSARVSREHNDANVLAMGAHIVDANHAKQIVDTWLKTKFQGGRHARRVKKIENIEAKYKSNG